jgi:hypothetical protein
VLLIGIDEAGYGPRLGPLCHGYCALRGPEPADGGIEPPDLWKVLRPSVMRYPAYEGAITVDDSKKIYSPALGLNLLRHGVSAFLECISEAGNGSIPVIGDDAALLRAMYERILPQCDRESLEEDAWGCLPPQTAISAEDIAAQAASALTDGAAKKVRVKKVRKSRKRIPPLREALSHCRMSVVALGARALSARHYNSALQTGGNKADVNWSVIATQFTRMMALAEPAENVYAVIDRQGGRKFYAGKIGALFPGAMPWVEVETQRKSVYKIEHDGRTVRVAFLVEADGETLPVALASMAAKLARELCMQRLNAYFKQHVPELRPTAGYYGDANRFLRETKSLRETLGIGNGAFVRVK